MEPRRTALGTVLICYLLSQVAAKSFDVVWVSPAKGATYSPGDTIVGKWMSTSAVVSPGFKLCEVVKPTAAIPRGLYGRGGDEEGEKCGTAIWPQVQEMEDGYMITITAPEASEKSEYCLEMQDNFGNLFKSPVFELGVPSSHRPSDMAEASFSSMKASGSQENSVESVSTPTKISDSSARSMVTKHSSVSPSVSPTNPVNSLRIGVPSPSNQPDVLVSRRPVPTAAFAVPLSVASAIILVAGLMCLRTRRKMAEERRQEFKTLILSKRDTDNEGYGSMGEVQRTISVLSRKGHSGYSNSLEPMPVFLPRPEPRMTTRNPYAPMASSASSSTIFDDNSTRYYEESTATRVKSLTDQYTAVGTRPRSEESIFHTMPAATPAVTVPYTLLPAKMPPLHVRSESPGNIHPLPVPPSQSSSSSLSGTGDVYDAITAKLKRS